MKFMVFPELAQLSQALTHSSQEARQSPQLLRGVIADRLPNSVHSPYAHRGLLMQAREEG